MSRCLVWSILKTRPIWTVFQGKSSRNMAASKSKSVSTSNTSRTRAWRTPVYATRYSRKRDKSDRWSSKITPDQSQLSYPTSKRKKIKTSSCRQWKEMETWSGSSKLRVEMLDLQHSKWMALRPKRKAHLPDKLSIENQSKQTSVGRNLCHPWPRYEVELIHRKSFSHQFNVCF